MSEPMYPLVPLKTTPGAEYSKGMFSHKIETRDGELVAIVFGGGQKGKSTWKDKVKATADELAGRYDLHEDILKALRQTREALLRAIEEEDSEEVRKCVDEALADSASVLAKCV